MNNEKIIETVLLACEDSLSINRIRRIINDFDIDDKEIVEIINKLNNSYKESKKGFYIESIANGYQVRTLPEFHKYIQIAKNDNFKYKLSKAAFEVLSIISFRQPISRSDIEFVRGVDCSGIIRKLLDQKIIKIKGRDTKNTKALLYSTTALFLEKVGLNHIGELPKISEIKELIGKNETE